MDQAWRETNLLLDSLLHQYRTIYQELEIATDRERELQLRAWASTCVDEYLATIRRYRAAKQTETIVSPCLFNALCGLLLIAA